MREINELTISDAPTAEFLDVVASSAGNGTFVRLTLGKYRGQGDLTKIVVTPLELKGAKHLKFVMSHARKDITQNFLIAPALERLAALIGADFLSATLFTTTEDVTLQFTKKRAARMVRGKPTFAVAAVGVHNRAKAYIVDAGRPYLQALGVTQSDGTVRPSMYAKFKQICHFVEIVDQLLADSSLRDAAQVTVTDIGSGKGYLTFALYDHLTAKLGKVATVTGVEMRADMVALCSDIAQRARFDGLSFQQALAENAATAQRNVIIALHACDTATDDAIFQGISSNAALILTAPCCQHELAPQLHGASQPLHGLLKYGLFKQRQADLVTDAVRCLLLEASGYRVKVIEFVSTEHTAKNILIAAVRADGGVQRSAALAQFEELKKAMGFQHQRLATLLNLHQKIDL